MVAPTKDSNGHAPDGGWGWVVCMASFVVQGLTIGTTYTFGVLFVDLLEYFGESESTTAWIGSIQPALLYLTGIIAGPLLKRFGWRTVTIAGSILSAIGFATSALSPNVYLLYFTYGGLTGIGNGLMYVTSMVAVQHYFEKRRAMATGIAVAGSGVGTLSFGFITRALLNALGWRWTLVVEAGIILIGVLCGILYRPLPNGDNSDVVDEQTSLVTSGNASEKQESYSTVDGVSYHEHEEQQNKCCCGSSPFCSLLSEVFDFSMLKNPIFVIVCISIILFCFGYHVPFTFTPERATKMYGVDTTSAAWLVSIMGISNVSSRLIFGWIADKSAKGRFFLGGITLALGGFVSCLIFFFTTYPLMVLYSVLFGAFTGCWTALFPVILVDLLGVDVIEKSLGQALAAGSISFLLASPMSGFIVEKTGSYNYAFLVVGIAETCGGILLLTSKCFQEEYGYHSPELIRRVARSRRQSFMSESFA